MLVANGGGADAGASRGPRRHVAGAVWHGRMAAADPGRGVRRPMRKPVRGRRLERGVHSGPKQRLATATKPTAGAVAGAGVGVRAGAGAEAEVGAGAAARLAGTGPVTSDRRAPGQDAGFARGAGIPDPRRLRMTGAREAPEAAARIGFPVAVKLVSERLAAQDRGRCRRPGDFEPGAQVEAAVARIRAGVRGLDAGALRRTGSSSRSMVGPPLAELLVERSDRPPLRARDDPCERWCPDRAGGGRGDDPAAG